MCRFPYRSHRHNPNFLKLLVLFVTLSFGLPFIFVPLRPFLYPTARFANRSNTSANEIFILSFDGVLAQTSRWRAHMGLAVALRTWPFLKNEERYRHLISLDETGQNWIINKMIALSHALRSDGNAMMGCDEVLLARMLLEEQALDQGRSDGSLGKYGSQFHPRKSYHSTSNKNGSRPLTVGEISANWIEGACLRDTIRTKYSIQRRDPIPIIQDNISTFLKEEVSLYFYSIIFLTDLYNLHYFFIQIE